jgi:hypothetical protein
MVPNLVEDTYDAEEPLITRQKLKILVVQEMV